MSKNYLQKGDLILVTGATGWVGSHIVNTALQFGLGVRLAVRNEAKAQGLITAMRTKYGSGAHIEVALLADANQIGAYDEIVQGVQGIIHSAANMSLSSDYEEVVTGAVQGYKTLLEAAHSQGKAIKRVILTSSSFAVADSNLDSNKPVQRLNVNSWNQETANQAKTNPNALNVYVASKVESERFAWNFVETHKPAFILNTVCPSVCWGEKVIGTEYLSSGQVVRKVAFEADQVITGILTSQYFVDVNDVALLHILAATKEDIVNERILGYSEVFTWDQVIDLAHEYCPEKVNAAKKTDSTCLKDNTVVDVERTKEILQSYGGLKTLKESVLANLKD